MVLITMLLSHIWDLQIATTVAVDTLVPNAGPILSLRPTNERRRYKVTPSPIGWTQA